MSVFEKMKRIIAEELDVKETEVLPESSFADDLGADSLGYIVLLQALEAEFNIQIPDADTAKLKTVEDAVKYIKDRVNNEG
ncbi:acyl carrier protein [candidate division WOR-3 bacterium]|nr:acyl carrier protein [candidate division WOR-3 bacterium]